MAGTAEYAGVEYAIRDDTTGKWFRDADADGRDLTWEFDPDNASWKRSVDELMDMAIADGLVDGVTERLTVGFNVWQRPWVYEDDIDEDYETPEPIPCHAD